MEDGDKLVKEKAGRKHREDGTGRREMEEERSRPACYEDGSTVSTEAVSLNC